MACARCHDAPLRPYKQRQLFGIAALLERAPLKVPSTSSVDFAGRARRPRVKVTLKPGTAVSGRYLDLAAQPAILAGAGKPTLEALSGLGSGGTGRRLAKAANLPPRTAGLPFPRAGDKRLRPETRGTAHPDFTHLPASDRAWSPTSAVTFGSPVRVTTPEAHVRRTGGRLAFPGSRQRVLDRGDGFRSPG